MKSLAILGTSRSDGNTRKTLDQLIAGTSCEFIDLNDKQIAHFDYEQNYNDDFLAIIHQILDSEITILATPVYWYSYSSVMKVFIDRFSDLLTSQKELGRRLRGKKFVLVASGSTKEPDEMLNSAFSKFCDYLETENLGYLYTQHDFKFANKELSAKIRRLLVKS